MRRVMKKLKDQYKEKEKMAKKGVVASIVPKTKSGGTEEQYIEGVSNNSLLKKRQRSSISWGKTRSAMLLGLDVLDCPICFEALTIPIFQCKKRLLFALQCFNEPHGLYVTVRCIAPSALELGNLAYCLYYSMDGHTLTYKLPEVKRVLEVSSETPQDNFMFIPHSLLRGELLEKKITIGLKLSKFSKQSFSLFSIIRIKKLYSDGTGSPSSYSFS